MCAGGVVVVLWGGDHVAREQLDPQVVDAHGEHEVCDVGELREGGDVDHGAVADAAGLEGFGPREGGREEDVFVRLRVLGSCDGAARVGCGTYWQRRSGGGRGRGRWAGGIGRW